MTEGQAPGQLTEEELKNMTPEQIAEMQKQNCIFCHIVSGKVASKKVYEDEKCTGILDINPANPGHVVIIPKEHYSIMPQIPEDVLGHMFMVAKGISHATLKAFKAQGTNIFVANGLVAGQRAQHFMIHIIPRKDNDGITIFNIPHKQIDDAELEQIRGKIKNRVDEIFGLKKDVLDLDKPAKKEESDEERIKKMFEADEQEENQEEEQEEKEEQPGQDVEEQQGNEEDPGNPEQDEEEPEEDDGSKDPEEEKKKEPERTGPVNLDEIADLFK